MTATRVVVASEHALACSGLCAILNEDPNIDVVGQIYRAPETLSEVRRLQPDLMLIDVINRDASWVRLVEKLAKLPAEPRIRTLMLVAGVDDYVLELLQVGAAGFLLRDMDPRQLSAAIQVVAAGYKVLASAGDSLDSQAVQSALASTSGDRLSALTPREREVLGLVVRGHSNSEIAASLTLSESTVKYHVQRLLGKLGVHDRVHAVIYAYEAGLVQRGTASRRRT